jgi:hypothetical protein
MQNKIATHNLKEGDILYLVENKGTIHKIVLEKQHFECNHTYLNHPSPVIYNYVLKPKESVVELYDQSLILWSAVQENGKVEYIPIPSKIYLDKDVAEKVAAQIKDVHEKLNFAKIYKKLVFMHPRSHRYMTTLDVNSKSIKEKVETWQKQYNYEEIPFKMFFINDYGEVYRYDELLNDFIEYQKALELKDKLDIEL